MYIVLYFYCYHYIEWISNPWVLKLLQTRTPLHSWPFSENKDDFPCSCKPPPPLSFFNPKGSKNLLHMLNVQNFLKRNICAYNYIGLKYFLGNLFWCFCTLYLFLPLILSFKWSLHETTFKLELGDRGEIFHSWIFFHSPFPFNPFCHRLHHNGPFQVPACCTRIEGFSSLLLSQQ